MRSPDAVVVGSGPNGLAAALMMARAGYAVDVFEGADTPGGGCRTAELTLPGFRHDVCSAVHPLAAASPFFLRTDLAARGVTLLTPRVAFANPIDGGRAGAVAGSVPDTANGLGADAAAYRRLLGPLVRDAGSILPAILAPLRSVPAHPVAVGRFGLEGLLPASLLVRGFGTPEARALLAGVSAHSFLPLHAPGSGGFGLLLTMLAHSVGWPVVEGGSGRLVDALVGELTALGGQVITGQWIKSLQELPPARATLLDVTPRQFIAMAGDALPARYARALAGFRYGPGICKVDWALSGPVPWTAAACREAGTLHLGGTFEETARSEAEVTAGKHPERPFCIVAQPGIVDSSRRPGGPADAVGLLSCAVRLDGGHDRPDRGADRALRPRLPGPDPGPGHPDGRRGRGAQPELHRRRYRRRPRHAAPDDLPAGHPVEPLPDRPAGRLPVLVIHLAGRRGARHVRRVGGPLRAG